MSGAGTGPRPGGWETRKRAVCAELIYLFIIAGFAQIYQ